VSKLVTFPSRRAGGSLLFSAAPPAPLSAHLNTRHGLMDDPDGEAALLGAVTEWPRSLDARIALYKFYFRRGRYVDAERAVWATLREAARQSGFRWNYRLLRPDTADWEDHAGPARLYLFSLKALGVVRLRRGKIEAARRVLEKLLELDPHDGVGGEAFLSIALTFEPG
jgi:tetratricopeptide (TPR) repeat protein